MAGSLVAWQEGWWRVQLALETTWPDLPLPKVDYSGAPRYSTIVSKRDAAYIARRSRFERSYATLYAQWCLTTEQLEAFETFYLEELDNGIAQFKIELRYPENSVLKEWAVQFDQNGYTVTHDEGHWLVQAALDIVGPVTVPERELLVPVTDGLLACWEALDLEGYANNDPVKTWPDVSGWEHHATTPPVSGAWPKYTVNAFGTSPGVAFDGSANKMDITCPVGLSNVTLFVVCKMPVTIPAFSGPINWGGDAGFVFYDGRANAVAFMPSFVKTNPVTAAKELTGDYTTWPVTYPVPPRLFVIRYAVGVLTFRYQGAAGVPNLDTYTGWPALDALGKGGDNAVCWSGTLGAILVYNRALLDAEMPLVEAYLNSRYPCF